MPTKVYKTQFSTLPHYLSTEDSSMMLNYKSFLILFTIVLSVLGGVLLPSSTPRPDTRIQRKCITTADSKDPGKPCKFPFTFKGKRYSGCSLDDYPDPEVQFRGPWCSTAVSRRYKFTERGNFGFCNKNCRVHKRRSKSLYTLFFNNHLCLMFTYYCLNKKSDSI